MRKKLWLGFLMPFMSLLLMACGDGAIELIFDEMSNETINETTSVVEGEAYDTAQEVVDYIDSYGALPPNYLTKQEARDLGWKAREGNLWEVAPDASIGGDYFGNFEELLPEKSDRDYYEADIDYDGGSRNAKRLVFSNDGLYFYTEDHYESFNEMKPGGE